MKTFGNKKYFISLFLIVISTFVAAIYFYNQKHSSLKIPIPYTLSVENNTSFACESLMYSGIFGDTEKYLANGIEGQIGRGIDKVAMTIKDPQTLHFITGASVGIGMSEGDNFVIVKNNAERLMAVGFGENAISTLVLNKKNGLTVWLKGNPSFLNNDIPNGQIIYLVCR